MPRIYKYFRHIAGEDAFVVPRSYALLSEISFDDGKTWLASSECFSNNAYKSQFQNKFSVRNTSSTTGQHWFGWSNPYYPGTTGHTYIVTMEVRLSAIGGTFKFYSQTTASALTATTLPGTANQTEYTRVWAVMVGTTFRNYISFNPSTAGVLAQIDVRDFDIIDVTGIDTAYYDLIGKHDWTAFHNDLSAIDMNLTPGLARQGNLLYIDVASKDELAAGALYKAVTADKLKEWVDSSDSYKVLDNSGNEVLLQNLAETYTKETMTAISYSSNAQDAVWDTMRSVWGTMNSGTYGGKYYDATTVVRNKWIISNPASHKYIVTYDVMNETSKSDSCVGFATNSGTMNTITDISNRTYSVRVWEHCGFLLTAAGNFTLELRIYGLTTGDQFRASFKNFKLYDVTNIPSSYYPAIAAGKRPLLQGESPVQISGKMISYKKASVADVIGGTTNKDYIVDAHTLHSAVNLGRAVDVTTEALYKTLVPPTTYDIRGEFELTASGASSGAEKYYGFTYDPSLPFPKYAEDENHQPFHYLFVADVKNNSTVALDHIAFNDVANTAYKAASVGSVPIRVDNLPANQDETSYTRIAALVTTPWNCIRAAQTTGSAQTIKVGVRGWRQYEVTMLSDEAVEALAKMSVAELDDAYYRYLVKQDAVCPFIPIIDMGSAAAVTLQAGLAYKLTATTGTHTLSVDTLPANAQGQEAYISITTATAGTITVQAPLVLMDPIRANAVNNCRIVYRNDEARLYVDDVANGYIVVNASGTDEGSLFYGMTRPLDSMEPIEFISITSVLDGTSIEVSSVVSALSKPISITGNGKEATDITFLRGSIGSNNTLAVSEATIRDFNLISGLLDLDYACATGNAMVTGGTIRAGRQTELNLNINGAYLMFASDISVSGTAVVDLQYMQNKRPTFATGSIDGLTLKNGLCTTTGGALLVSGTGTASLTNMTISGSTSGSNGGGVYINAQSGTIANCIVTGCTASTRGGGLCLNNSTATNLTTVSGAQISFCTSLAGGGINAWNNAIISDSTISYCTATSSGSAIAVYSASVSVTGTLIDNCTGTSVVESSGISTISLSGCTITNCVSDKDTGLLYAGSLQVSNTTVKGNTVSTDYTVISRSNSTFTNCLFTNNKLDVSGSTGGLFYAPSGISINLTGCTFTSNAAQPLSLAGSGVISLTNVSIDGGIIYSASTSATLNISGTFVFKGVVVNATSNSYPRVSIAAGSTISFLQNGAPEPIRGNMITAQGTFTVIDADGNSHEYSSATKTNSAITNRGIWS